MFEVYLNCPHILLLQPFEHEIPACVLLYGYILAYLLALTMSAKFVILIKFILFNKYYIVLAINASQNLKLVGRVLATITDSKLYFWLLRKAMKLGQGLEVRVFLGRKHVPAEQRGLL